MIPFQYVLNKKLFTIFLKTVFCNFSAFHLGPAPSQGLKSYMWQIATIWDCSFVECEFKIWQ